MFSKKGLLLTVMVFVMAASLLLGGSAELMAEDVTTITVAAFPDQDSGFEAILDDFHEKHPHIRVEMEVADFDDHHQSLLTRIAAGSNVPDVANVEIAFIGDFVNRGGFENLSGEPYHADRFEEDIISYKWAQGSNEETGNLIAMPLDISPGTMFYRRDRLEELGVDIDDLQTMEDWIEVGREFSEEDGQWLFSDAVQVYEMIRRSDDQRFFDDDGEPIITSDKFVRAFELAKMVRDEGLDANIGAWTNEWYSTFQEGTVLVHPSGAWLGGHIQNWMAPETAGKWGVADLPDDMFIGWGGSFVAIPEDAENKEEAWEFIKYVTTNVEPQIGQFEAANIFPSLLAAFDNEIFEVPSDFYAGQNVRELWLNAAQQIPEVNSNRYDNIAEDIVGDALGEVLENDKDIMQALEDAEQLLRRRMR